MSEDETKHLFEEGTIINGKWTILDHIATGGKGEVYLAKQRDLDRRVALKIISRAFLKSLADDEAEMAVELERFRREVQVMARLRHPNILQVFDYDQVEIDGSPLNYLVMEYVPGPTLALTMPEDGLGSDAETLKNWIRQYFLPVCNGMEAVHAQGVIHRDIKPANVLIDDGTPKIADFGLAGGNVRDCVTQDHHILGTLPYMAEEQFLDLNLADTRADVFSLGRVLFEAMAGKKALKKAKPFDTVGLENPVSDFQKRLDRIIRQASAKNVAKRLPSVRTLRLALEELVAEAPTKGAYQGAPHRTVWLVSAAILAVLFGGGLLYHFLWQMPSRQAGQVELKMEKATPQPSPMPQAPAQPGTETPPPLRLAPGETPPQRLATPDGSKFALVPGGEISLKSDGGTLETIQVAPFYMEETQVTNHQYIMFLNRVRNHIQVKKEAVYGEDGLWLLLGEVAPGYEPIAYRDGEFVMDMTNGVNPVVRVTAKGARAYAHFFGRRIPTLAEWELARQEGAKNEKPVSILPLPSPFQLVQHMHAAPEPAPPLSPAPENPTQATPKQVKSSVSPVPKPVPTPSASRREVFPVGEASTNGLGIKGLGVNVNEWTTVKTGAETEYFIVGGARPSRTKEPYKRQKWEAFGDVGFRTVIPLPQPQTSM
ncbi:bifunctional serine/threonine-protein kinase/formylglycine-generating enzyme family protein [Desulfovibrio sp. TomC]|uniref:bifunctional serine/threonine-protein kinase/formylglycine-generating enzyme family protein n=1 Tax=Desulfovibrio sp. TomC TaxID=1562888 RepID=UPI0005744783|nr:bifunctional serine/threonine-protein kinase/formylglycine-generating enzyme family protein [Desulfovibrio sp. TomC]KHK00355.1 Serine/threonine kinase [Desulfovibrio sp. TomC]